VEILVAAAESFEKKMFNLLQAGLLIVVYSCNGFLSAICILKQILNGSNYR